MPEKIKDMQKENKTIIHLCWSNHAPKMVAHANSSHHRASRQYAKRNSFVILHFLLCRCGARFAS
jgi:hypothetical protein